MIEKKHKLTEAGDIKVHNRAIRSIAQIAISKIPGIIGIRKSLAAKFLSKIGITTTIDMLDGIKVETFDSGTRIIINVIVAYGVEITDLASKAQDDVRQAVENMTGIPAVEVDINIAGVEPE